MAETTASAKAGKHQPMATKKEMLGHAMGGLGQNTVYALWSNWITPFYTDVFKLNPIFMSVIFLGARIWDGVNDPMMGIIADRTKSRFGRFRCWLLRMPLVVAVCLVLNFTVPSFGGAGSMVFAAVTYVLMGMAFTSVDIPYWSLPAAMTNDPQERTKIFTFSTMATNVASALAGALIPTLLMFLGGREQARSYFILAIIIAAFGGIMYLSCFALVREHVKPASKAFSFKLAFKNLYTNTPLFCVMIANLVINLAFILKMNFNYYFFVYNMDNFAIMPIISLITVPCMIVGSLSVPILSKAIGKKRTVLVLMGANLVISTLFFITGYSSLPLVMLFTILQVVCVGGATVCINAMTADTIEYGEWKTGQRNDGIITSTRTLITKIASALSGFAVGMVLTATHYVPNAVQSAQTTSAFHFVVSMLTGIVMFLGVVPMFFYKLTEKRHAEIVAEINARRAENGEPQE